MGILILCCFCWYCLGIWGFIFWWTTEHDFTSKEILLCFLVGAAGPIAFIVGYFIHGRKNKPPIIIIRKKGQNP